MPDNDEAISMKNTDYHCSFVAKANTAQALKAISHVSEWWAKRFEGSARRLGDVFTVRFGDTFVTFRVSELVAYKKVVWLVSDCQLPWLENKTEWNGTTCVWELSTQGEITQVKFTHVGLVPGIECYEVCRKGWNEYVAGSLYNLITAGKGQPN